ncbi:MAG TPA: response regulator [Chthoniobacteraceae bacterium]|nr:response regulator [Chthoniobacteraceae bacterium]
MNQSNAGSPVEILLVEDNQNDAKLTRELLLEDRLQNNLVIVDDGVEALAYLRAMGEYRGRTLPDIILLDLNLPKKDGREVLAEIKTDSKLRHIPVIILTSSRAEEDILKAYNLNVSSYIIKPVNLDKFVRALRNIDGFWLNVVKVPAV